MKKRLSAAAAAICLTAVLLLSSCAKASKGDIVGQWKYSLNSEIRDLVTEVLADSGVYDDIYYEFREDGTGCTYTTNNPDPVNFTYTFDGSTLHIENGDGGFDTACKVDGDTLSVTENGTTVKLDRQ